MKGTQRRFVGLAVLAAALLLVSGLFAGAGARVSAHEGEPHPAHIHTGTCAALGEVVFPLQDVAMSDNGTPTAMDDMDMSGTPASDDGAKSDDEGDDNGSDDMGDMHASPPADDGEDYGDPAGESTTTVQADLATILGAEHAINVHESMDAIQNYIACGEITGTPENGKLDIELKELNDSGYSGEATLTDNGDGTTTVEIELYEQHKDGAAATGEAAVSIKDFAFNPPTLEVAVGTTVTWTNNDTVPHTVSQSGGGFESGKLDPGATFSFTFSEAGSFDYFCQFHPNMKATIVVK